MENAEYVIKAHLMLCGIHHFFEDPKVVVPEPIRKFWRTAKVYRNEFIGGYFIEKVLGIIVKLTIETIAQAICCEHRGTKFMNSQGNKLEDHIGNFLWGPNWANMPKKYGTLLSKAKIFQ